MQAFDRERYALNHPAGAIGRALVLKVSDVMRTGDHFAKVPPETTVLDALLAMTKAQCGSAVVADAEGRLAGIFTDGDFRRAVANGDASVLAEPVSRFMTRNPVSIGPDALAVDVLHLLERRAIDDLPVVDAEGRLAGAIDIQDLPKFKVM